MHLFRRTLNLVRGLVSRWLGRREHGHPDAVYEAAIHERLARYVKLREATAGILYLRSKLAKELERQSDELVRVRRQLEIAVDRNDDQVAFVSADGVEQLPLLKKTEVARRLVEKLAQRLAQ